MSQIYDLYGELTLLLITINHLAMRQDSFDLRKGIYVHSKTMDIYYFLSQPQNSLFNARIFEYYSINIKSIAQRYLKCTQIHPLGRFLKCVLLTSHASKRATIEEYFISTKR